MSLISKIRNNSWILVVMIALGLGGFILMDMTAGQQSIFGGTQTTVGSVNGNKLDLNQFNREEEILYGGTPGDPYANRNALWNSWVDFQVINQEAEEVGLGVSKTELIDLQFGTNLSPIISSRFANPQTGQLDRNRLNEFKNAIETGQLTDPSIRGYWKYQEKEIIARRLQDKLNGMVSKALYTPNWMAEMVHQEQNETVSFAYVKVPFDEIDNTDVSLSDSDYKDYLNENQKRYEVDEETRTIEYVVFDVLPTAADSAFWREELEKLIPEMDSTTADSAFFVQNEGVYNTAYLKRAQLTGVAPEVVFDMNPGSIYGPVLDGETYKVVKVLDKMVVPDSVRSRHILRPVTTQMEFIQANALLDSLIQVIESGQNSFDSLAAEFGTDGTATTGGDLGYAAQGTMVKEFNDAIFFQMEEGELKKVITQFGLHLVEVTDKKYVNNEEGVQLGYITQEIVPTDETQREVRRNAMTFLSNNRSLEAMREAAAADDDLDIVTIPGGVRANDFSVGQLGGGQSSREMVRWAFNATVGEVSPDLYDYQDAVGYFDNKYVVAALQSVQKPGIPSVESVKDDIELQVMNRKKGQILAEAIQGMELSGIASKYSTKIDTIDAATFSSSFLPNLGNEPKVVAKAFTMQEGQASDVIIGNTGVFKLQLTNRTPAGAATNLPQLRRTLASGKRAAISSTLLQSLRDNAKIVDNRSRFF
jgi:peptidyl-prolyl cis-trans isomerase D